MPCGAPGHPLRNAPRCLSLRYGFLSANKRGEYSRVATDAIRHSGREIIFGPCGWFFRCPDALAPYLGAGGIGTVSFRRNYGLASRATSDAFCGFLFTVIRHDVGALVATVLSQAGALRVE